LKKVVFITPPDAEFGFGLAGIAHSVTSEHDVQETLETKMAEPDTGLIILDERLIPATDEQKMRTLEGRWHGIILSLPSPRKPAAEIEDYAVRLIRRAIGYHVRLKP
jgi:V/A-type H+-transporting ATPase subunit F